MKSVKIGSFIALSGLSATSLYAQPPDSVSSDIYSNTAMGGSALLRLVTPTKTCVPYAISSSGAYMSGCFNTAAGAFALQANTTGFDNTSVGAYALVSNTSGSYNTATGALAMYNTTTGGGNSAFGAGALFFNSAGFLNTGAGSYALFNNTSGSNNTGLGALSMLFDTTGSYNTASGSYALYSNTIGNNMTAIGYQALYSNTTGSGNNAQGFQAMYSNTTGSNNSAIGDGALYSNTTGIGNNAVGLTSLENMTAGNRNTAVGNNAGLLLSTGSYNTYIGWQVGPASVGSTENYVTRIGVTYADPNVNVAPTTFITGIYTSPVAGGIPVVVNSAGQLGFAGSSERFKTDITPLGPRTGRLTELRPVSFHVKSDPSGAIQYGLIAEEVDKVYPELVIRDKDGKIQGLRYDELAPMLLNEMQKQQQVNAEQSAKIASLEQQHADMQKQLAELHDLKQELNAALGELKSKQAIVAQR
jgi:hypothetical protein